MAEEDAPDLGPQADFGKIAEVLQDEIPKVVNHPFVRTGREITSLLGDIRKDLQEFKTDIRKDVTDIRKDVQDIRKDVEHFREEYRNDKKHAAALFVIVIVTLRYLYISNIS
jgi:hypothetical protein